MAIAVFDYRVESQFVHRYGPRIPKLLTGLMGDSFEGRASSTGLSRAGFTHPKVIFGGNREIANRRR